MGLRELVERVAERSGCSRREVTAVLRSFFFITQTLVMTGERVKLTGFGVFMPYDTRPRPLFGRRMSVGRRTIRFKASRSS